MLKKTKIPSAPQKKEFWGGEPDGGMILIVPIYFSGNLHAATDLEVLTSNPMEQTNWVMAGPSMLIRLIKISFKHFLRGRLKF